MWSNGENVPPKTLTNGLTLAENVTLAVDTLTRGGGAQQVEQGPLFRPPTRQPQLARSSISVWTAGGIILLRVSEAIITFTPLELWLCWQVH